MNWGMAFALGAGILNLAVIVFFIASLVRESPRWSVATVVLGLASGLVIMGGGWFVYMSVKAQVLQAAPGDDIWAWGRILPAMAGVGKWITWCLVLSLIPFVTGTGELIRALLNEPWENEKESGPVAGLIAAVCIAAGVGFSLVALLDYLRFDDLFLVLVMLTV